MFKPHYGTCVECNNKNVIIPVKSGLCQKCNYESKQAKKHNRRNGADNKGDEPNDIHSGKSHPLIGRDEEGYGGGSGTEGFKLVGRTPTVVRKPIKKKPIQHRRKPSGEKAVFEEIWEENTKDGQATCYVCGKNIMEPTASNFGHILPKALNKYPLFKLYQNNIRLFCHDSYSSCHHRFDHEPRSSLKEPMWKKVFELEEQLKQEYNQLKKSI